MIFDGFVARIEGDSALVELTDGQGGQLSGMYPTADLVASGIGERDRFTLTVLERPDGAAFELQPVPRRVLSQAEKATIRESIAQALADYSPTDDY